MLPLNLYSRSSAIIKILLSSKHTRLCLLKLACIRDFCSYNPRMESEAQKFLNIPSSPPELVPHVPVFSTSDALSEVNITRMIKSTMRFIIHCSPCDDTLLNLIMYPTSFLQSIREVSFQKRMTAVGSEFPTFLIGFPSFSKFA